MNRRKHAGFTLIELLVVVAIIAILSAIAVPNLLFAQIRSKVAAAKADQSTLAVGLEAYHTDNNCYPLAVLVPPPLRLRVVTTPIAYLTELPRDPFSDARSGGGGGGGPFGQSGVYRYGAMGIDRPSRWALAGLGPDRQPDTPSIEYYPGYSTELFSGQVNGFPWELYDPTNGVISRGDVFRASDWRGE